MKINKVSMHLITVIVGGSLLQLSAATASFWDVLNLTHGLSARRQETAYNVTAQTRSSSSDQCEHRVVFSACNIEAFDEYPFSIGTGACYGAECRAVPIELKFTATHIADADNETEFQDFEIELLSLKSNNILVDSDAIVSELFMPRTAVASRRFGRVLNQTSFKAIDFCEEVQFPIGDKITQETYSSLAEYKDIDLQDEMIFLIPFPKSSNPTCTLDIVDEHIRWSQLKPKAVIFYPSADQNMDNMTLMTLGQRYAADLEAISETASTLIFFMTFADFNQFELAFLDNPTYYEPFTQIVPRNIRDPVDDIPGQNGTGTDGEPGFNWHGLSIQTVALIAIIVAACCSLIVVFQYMAGCGSSQGAKRRQREKTMFKNAKMNKNYKEKRSFNLKLKVPSFTKSKLPSQSPLDIKFQKDDDDESDTLSLNALSRPEMQDIIRDQQELLDRLSDELIKYRDQNENKQGEKRRQDVEAAHKSYQTLRSAAPPPGLVPEQEWKSLIEVESQDNTINEEIDFLMDSLKRQLPRRSHMKRLQDDTPFVPPPPKFFSSDTDTTHNRPNRQQRKSRMSFAPDSDTLPTYEL